MALSLLFDCNAAWTGFLAKYSEFDLHNLCDADLQIVEGLPEFSLLDMVQTHHVDSVY